jgi:hypothetical protein
MQINRTLAASVLVAFAFLFALTRTGLFSYWGQASQPLGKAPRIEFPAAAISQTEKREFLDGDFSIVTDVKALPHSVVAAFIEQGGSRLLMANPGKRFEVGDAILDSSVPRERLIFAGVLDAKCFVHYEQGGRGHSYIIAFFSMAPADRMRPVWRGYCARPALNISELRSEIASGSCRDDLSTPPPL